MIVGMDGDSKDIMRQTLLSFENYLLANKRTEKPVIHISLNPSPEDKLTEGEYAALAKEYMQKMGYGDQPYIVYMHEDIDRRHLHIVSVGVDENGRKISDKYERVRSMKACRELERKYNLKQITNERNEFDTPYLKKVDYAKGDIKKQISNLLKTVAKSYKYHSLVEYNALLSCFNVQAKKIAGEHEGEPYSGIAYYITDDKGKELGAPLKSSLFGKEFGYEALEKRMKHNLKNLKEGKTVPKIRDEILRSKLAAGNMDDFIGRLRVAGIDTVLRINEQGRLYGVTFIDHNNKEVYNGSRLGKELSAGAFQYLLDSQVPSDFLVSKHGFEAENSMQYDNRESVIEQAFGIIGGGSDYDPDEEEFKRQARIKKKKRKGIKR